MYCTRLRLITLESDTSIRSSLATGVLIKTSAIAEIYTQSS